MPSNAGNEVEYRRACGRQRGGPHDVNIRAEPGRAVAEIHLPRGYRCGAGLYGRGQSDDGSPVDGRNRSPRRGYRQGRGWLRRLGVCCGGGGNAGEIAAISGVAGIDRMWPRSYGRHRCRCRRRSLRPAGEVSGQIGVSDVRRGYIRLAVAVEIGGDDVVGADGQRDRSRKRPVPVPHCEHRAAHRRHGDVGGAIPVEIPHRKGIKVGAIQRGPGLRGERSIAAAEQYCHGSVVCAAAGIVSRIGNRQIQLAVAVEIPGHHRYGAALQRHGRARHEGPISFAQQNRHRAIGPVGNGQIRNAVSVEVPGRNGFGLISSARAGRWRKGSISVTKQNRRTVGIDANHCQVGDAVPVEVRRYHG